MVDYQHLIGRSFLWGVRDCYALVRDFYDANFQLKLANYARPTNWHSDQSDIIRQVHKREGFRMITDWTPEDLRPGDLLCMSVGESAPNHLSIYVGDNKVLHHLYGRLSSEDPFRDFFRSTTGYVLRHPEVPDLRVVLPTKDIRSLLDERYRVAPAE